MKKTVNHLIIPDLQVRPGQDLTYLDWIGEYMVEQRPDTLVCIGDFFDLPSLSSYDKGRACSEGRRLSDDLDAGRRGMDRLLRPLRALQVKQKKNKDKVYRPNMVFTLGNHEERLARHVDANPELVGFVDYADFCLERHGWVVHDYLKPVEVDGITYVHYLANPFTGKPYGGTALTQLKNVGKSFVVGHKQCLDIAVRPIIDGSMQLGVVCGACYPHNEAYKGYQGNSHFRGLIVLHDVKDGYGDIMCVSLDYLKRVYEDRQ